MRISARAFIRNGSRFLFMKRQVNGVHYYTLIGGGIEKDETPEQACLREIFEESSLTVAIVKEIARLEDRIEDKLFQHIVFYCLYKDGVPALNGEEKLKATLDNTYEPVWVNRDQIASMLIKPQCITDALKSGVIDIDRF